MDHTKKRFGKKDAVFIGLLLIIAILIFFFTNYFQKETGAMVTVAVDGKVYGTYDLEKEQTIDIKAGDKTTNILKISDGKAYRRLPGSALCPPAGDFKKKSDHRMSAK